MATPAEVQLARRLRELREQAGLTQAQLASIFSDDGKRVSAGAISSWENLKHPSPLPENRLEPYTRVPMLSGSPPHLVPIPELTSKQRTERDELVEQLGHLLEQTHSGSAAAESARVASYRSWYFGDGGPVVIIAPDAPPHAQGPLADDADPNYTDLHRYADLDALVELHGHIRAENDLTLPVFFKRASTVAADDLSGHVVLLGGVSWNRVTRRLLRQLSRLPVRQVEVPEVSTGEIFAVGHGKAERRFLPTWSRPEDDTAPELEEDVALLARVSNPFNSSRTLTLCNGVHSRGVLGAVRALTDAMIRESNEAYLAHRFPKGEFGVLLKVPVFHGRALSPDLQNPASILYAWPEGIGSGRGGTTND